MDKAKALLVVPLWLLAILGLLMGALRLTINRPGYFSNIYEEMDTQSRIGISPADCTDAMMAMIGYMEGSRDSIQLTVTEYGRQVQMFNQQEIDHMVDVRALYQTFRDLGDVGLASLGLFLIGMAAWSRWPGLSRQILRGWWVALGIFAGVLVMLGVYAAVDFSDFWTRFHYVFFTNDLWLMDYATCRMIRICPLELFSGIIAAFTGLSLVGLAVVSLVVGLVGRRAGKEGAAA